jgi:UPF0755 protein
MMRNFFASVIALFLVAGIILVGKVYYDYEVWTYAGPDMAFTVSPGETFGHVNQRLYDGGLISNQRIFYRYVLYQKKLSAIRSGEFLIKSSSKMNDVYQSLFYGPSLAKKVVIPEGKNLFEIAKILEIQDVTSSSAFIALAKDEKLVKSLGILAPRMEGYLYPDTYQFAHQTKPIQIINTMFGRFKEKVGDLPAQHPTLTPLQVVTLASMVEKETGVAEERPMIAGVFFNRLKKKMRLQSDPTTIYGIYETFDGNLRRKDLEEKTDYNTYQIPGLPIGPICNPGVEAIQAVLHPAPNQYLYFVSNNDGTHTFSANFKDHNEAVIQLQINRKAREGKSWRDYSRKKKLIP